MKKKNKQLDTLINQWMYSNHPRRQHCSPRSKKLELEIHKTLEQDSSLVGFGEGEFLDGTHLMLVKKIKIKTYIS